MAANIRSLVNGGSPLVSTSRDDLTVADVITVESVDVATTYAWTLAYIPEGSAAVFSGDPLAQSPGTFTVDKEGPYLVRLTVDYGLPTENTEYVRLRYLTVLGSLKLVAAGENNDGSTPWPIPVDNTPDGWADQQNFNLLTLLGLVQQCVTSGNVVFADPTPGYGDFDTLQACIDYAVGQGASSVSPWVVAARNGSYAEDVTFKPHVHVIAWPMVQPELYFVRVQGTNGHTAALPNPGESSILWGLSLTSSAAAGTALTKTGSGDLYLERCWLQQISADATAGPGLDIVDGTVRVTECQIDGAQGGLLTDRFAVVQQAGTSTFFRSQLAGASGCQFDEGSTATLIDCQVVGNGLAGALGISSLATALTLEYCRVTAPTSGDAFQVNPTGAGAAGSVTAVLRWSYIGGDVYFDTNAIAGTTNLYLGSCEYDAITLPSGNPSTLEATTKGTSLFYDNATTGITAENVQDAIDEVHALAIAVQTLDDAYDGGVGGGLGRTIIADAGAVQVVDAASPSDPPAPDNPDGRIQAVGGVEVGSIDKAEILLDPNPYGNGPFIEMGRAVWPGNAPFGGMAFVQGRSTGDPLYRNYNLTVGTQPADGGGAVGIVTVRGGDAIQSGTTPNAAPVIVQAGSSTDGGVTPGDVVLIPGSVPGTDGAVFVASQNGASSAFVTANAALVGGVTGVARFGTDQGGFEVSIDAADNLAAVIAKFDATGLVTGSDAGGGVLRLTTVSTGPGAAIYYLNDDQAGALDIALGQFDGQPMTAGTVANLVPLNATGPFELSVGLGGPGGPLVYDAVTGKLTVPGLIDPTGLNMVQTPDAALPNQTLFVSDGATIPAGHAGYKDDVGVVHDLQVGGGGFVNPAPERFVFRPGGVAADNVYTNWAALMAAVGAASGSKEIVFDDTAGAITIPAGVWNVAGVALTDGDLLTNTVGTPTQVPVSLANGAILSGHPVLRNLDITGPPAGGAPFALVAGFAFLVLDNCTITSGGVPVVGVDGVGTTLVMYLLNSSITVAGGPVIYCSNNGSIAPSLQANSVLQNGTLSDDGTGTVFSATVTSSSFMSINPADHPAFNPAGFPAAFTYSDNALRMGYDNTGSGLTAINVQDAIDEIVGGPGSITVNDEGILVDANTTTLNFTGAGVTAAAGGPGVVNVSIPGGGGGASLAVTLGIGNQTTGIAIQSDGGGNARGTDALDLQQTRTAATQVASGTSAVVFGARNTAGGNRSFAHGEDCTASAPNAHAEGRNTTASAAEAHAEGRNTVASGFISHAEGLNTQALGNYSHAEGRATYANTTNSHAEGYDTHAGIYGTGDYCQHAEGRGTYATGRWSHAEGRQTRAVGDAAHAEGGSNSYGTFAYGNASHAEGENTYVTIAAPFGHAEGRFSQVSAQAGHAEGTSCLASGVSAHAEGSGCWATALGAHAEGANTRSTGLQSHAEGEGSRAYGDQSHAEGQSTRSIGNNSHAEGYNAYAQADYAHAGGNSSLADIEAQWARAVESAGGAARGSTQLSTFSVTALTTDASATVMLPRVVIRAEHAYSFKVMVTARQSGGAVGTVGDSSYFTCEGLIKRDAANNTTMVGVTNTQVQNDAGAAAWTATASADDVNEALIITVQGEVNKDITWHARVDTSEAGT